MEMVADRRETSATFDIQKGDNLFDIVFEFDRQLQVAQKYDSPVVFLVEIYGSLEEFLVQAARTQTEVVDTIFLKLIDFFIKCNCNYKRYKLSQLLNGPQTLVWSKGVTNRSESLKRLCHFWDFSVANGDYEAELQILSIFDSCTCIFFDLPAIYGVFSEAFTVLDPVAFMTYRESLVNSCSKCLQALHAALNEKIVLLSGCPETEREFDKLVELSKFAARLVLRPVVELVEQKKMIDFANIEIYRIILICALVSDVWDNERIRGLIPEQALKELLLVYF